MPKVISTINLKGGVGKTHTTVALADVLSACRQKRVLVIDLDPQTNATVMLIGEERWRILNERKQTLAQLFQDAFNPDSPKFDLSQALQKGVSDVSGASTIDLLPSSLDLIDLQDHLANVPSGKFYQATPIAILRKALEPLLDNYDLVLIDCPPNLGIITLNGLLISDSYVIPTVPDILSTYGIPQITKRIRDFSILSGRKIEPLGVVVSKYRAQSNIHRNTVALLQMQKDAPCFKTIIPESNSIAAAAQLINGKRTLNQKYGPNGEADKYLLLADEILSKI